MDAELKQFIGKLDTLDFKKMYNDNFFWTWDKTDDELAAVFTVADALRHLRENNISTRIFDSGLGISIFRDNSTRTRFSFASACNLLGLTPQDLDEKKSQIARATPIRRRLRTLSRRDTETGSSSRSRRSLTCSAMSTIRRSAWRTWRRSSTTLAELRT